MKSFLCTPVVRVFQGQSLMCFCLRSNQYPEMLTHVLTFNIVSSLQHDDYSGPLFYVRQSYWQQMGSISGTSAGRIHGGVRYSNTTIQWQIEDRGPHILQAFYSVHIYVLILMKLCLY